MADHPNTGNVVASQLLHTRGQRRRAVLPGFPTSAIFTFHAFVAPVKEPLYDHVLGGSPAPEVGVVPLEAELIAEKGTWDLLVSVQPSCR
jgi:molybdopterin biosynthesis enzyme